MESPGFILFDVHCIKQLFGDLILILIQMAKHELGYHNTIRHALTLISPGIVIDETE